MSKTKTLKKTILGWIALWLVFTAVISIMAAIFYKLGYFNSPTEEEYANLVEYVVEIKDNIIENENIRDSFLNENMTDIFMELSEGDIKTEVEITSKGLFIKAKEGNCIIEKEYELKKEYVFLEDGTKEAKGLILVANDTIQSRDTYARSIIIALYVIATVIHFLKLFAIIYSEKKKEKNS